MVILALTEPLTDAFVGGLGRELRWHLLDDLGHSQRRQADQ